MCFWQFCQNPCIGSLLRQITNKAHFYSLDSVVILKFDHGHLNCITSFPHHNNLSLAVWSKSMHWFTRYTADKVHFYSLNSVVTLKIGSQSPNSDQIVYLSQLHNTWSLAWNHHLVQDIECRQALAESKFDIRSANVTLKMRPRSPKYNHFFYLSQWCFCVSLFNSIHGPGDRVQTRFILQSL